MLTIEEFYNKVHSKRDGKFADTPGPGHAKGAPKATKPQAAALKKVLSKPKTKAGSVVVASKTAATKGATGRAAATKPAPQQNTPSKTAVTKATKAAVKKVEAKTPAPKKTVKVSAKVAAKVKAKPVEAKSGAAGSAPGLSHEAMAAFIKKNINKSPFDNVIALRDVAGFNAPPKKVSQAEFDTLKKSEIAVRAAPKAANKDLVNNRIHPMVEGGDYYGEGTYFARGKLAESHVRENYGEMDPTLTHVLHTHISRADLPYTVGHVASLGAYASWLNAPDSPRRTSALTSLSRKQPNQDPIPKDFVENATRLAAAIRASGKEKQFGNYEINEPAQIAMMLGIRGYRIPTPDTQVGLEYYNILDRSLMTVVG